MSAPPDPGRGGPDPDDWRYRRRAVASFLAWAGLFVAGAWLSGRGDPLTVELAQSVLTAAIVVLVTYMGAAIVDDWLKGRR